MRASPPLWTDRKEPRLGSGAITAADFIKRYYGNRDPDDWKAEGLTTTDLWRADKGLAARYAQQVKNGLCVDLGIGPETNSTEAKAVPLGTRRGRARKLPTKMLRVPAHLEPAIKAYRDKLIREELA